MLISKVSIQPCRSVWPLRPATPARVASLYITAGKGLTPYQGSKRCFGYYQCPACSKKWKSAYSWADCYQECAACYEKVYPYKMRKLKKREEEDEIETPPHQEALCQKCKKLGYSCTEKGKRHTRLFSMKWLVADAP